MVRARLRGRRVVRAAAVDVELACSQGPRRHGAMSHGRRQRLPAAGRLCRRGSESSIAVSTRPRRRCRRPAYSTPRRTAPARSDRHDDHARRLPAGASPSHERQRRLNQRVTFAAAPDTLVAVTARNLDREELLAIAGRPSRPTTPPLPLLAYRTAGVPSRPRLRSGCSAAWSTVRSAPSALPWHPRRLERLHVWAPSRSW